MADGLRVAFDCGSVRRNPTGVGVYIRELAIALLHRYGRNVVPFGIRPEGPLADLLGESTAARAMRGPSYHVWLQRDADAEARASRAQLAHYTHAVAPVRTRTPFVLTIHDLSLLRYPQYHPPLRLLTVPLLLASASRARAIIVPSRACRREVIRLLHARPERVHVVGHAPSRSHPAPDASAVLGRFGLSPGNYVLTVGTLEPRKNVERLIRAFQRFSRVHASPMPLVLIGASGWRNRRIRTLLATPGRGLRIIRTGYLSDEDRTTLMANSAVFAYVSLYEGYGIPVVEAMAVGAPVVTSSVSSLPEAAGGAAVLVNPYDETEIANGLSAALARREELIAAGRARTEKMSWAAVAEATMKVYREAEKPIDTGGR